jgi:hypothetical protein
MTKFWSFILCQLQAVKFNPILQYNQEYFELKFLGKHKKKIKGYNASKSEGNLVNKQYILLKG